MTRKELGINSLMSFRVFRTKGSVLLWINPKSPNTSNKYRENFIEEYSYVNNESACFADIEFDTKYSKEVTAELYGGAGRGGNYGGVRCGNFFHHQVKGIGTNQLLSQNASITQSNGIYSIHEAVRELLFTIIGNAVLPLGCVNILGIIFIGRSSHGLMHDFPSLPLCIAVREKVIRPAHYFHIGNKFVEVSSVKILEKNRLRQNFRQFFNGLNGFDDIKTFAINIGRQCAYSEIYRFHHGAISPSNIAIDGRWLDMTNASCIGFSNDYRATFDSASFIESKNAAKSILAELNDFISIYYSSEIDNLELQKTFEDSYKNGLREAFFLYHGIRFRDETEVNDKTYIDELILQYKKYVSEDIVDNFESRAKYVRNFYKKICKKEYRNNVSFDIFSLYEHVFSKEKIIGTEDNLNDSVYSCYMRAMKKIVFGPTFSNHNIRSALESFYGANNWYSNISKSEIAINDFIKFVDCIFSKVDIAGRLYLFNCDEFSIYYDEFSEKFIFDNKRHIAYHFPIVSELYTFLNSSEFCSENGLYSIVKIYFLNFLLVLDEREEYVI